MITEQQLRELKAGDIVTLDINDGVDVEVIDTKNYPTYNNAQNMCRITFYNGEECCYCAQSGGKVLERSKSLYDIVAIKPKPFDWADVKHGMAFKNTSYKCFHYVGVGIDGQLIFDFYKAPIINAARYDSFGDKKTVIYVEG